MSERCGHFQRALEELLDGEACREEAAEISEHLDSCPSCRDIQVMRLRMREMIRDCMDVDRELAPPALRARIMVSIHRQTLLRIRWAERGSV